MATWEVSGWTLGFCRDLYSGLLNVQTFSCLVTTYGICPGPKVQNPQIHS